MKPRGGMTIEAFKGSGQGMVFEYIRPAGFDQNFRMVPASRAQFRTSGGWKDPKGLVYSRAELRHHFDGWRQA
ncbi:hypothetical protein ACFFTN_01410 [Aminobacter aganoensis]|uniref:Uncharacterized protein n=1 Tax=Aminobacter aganoensis TaxID=83264 RepID=A0A7X0F5T3_9HYPH|nr:hypothetical protein [Aminobacter aganoensis]MBB6353483.1 hypothetical protein [Aminobacter aganoensis]